MLIYFFQIKYTEAILLNSTRTLLWFENTKLVIAVKEKKLLCHLLHFPAYFRSLGRIQIETLEERLQDYRTHALYMPETVIRQRRGCDLNPH